MWRVDTEIVPLKHATFRVLAALLASLGALVAGGAASALGGLPALPPVEISPPAISGVAVEGQTLTCSTGVWQNSPTSFSYSWQRDVTATIQPYSGNNQYTLTAADVGHAITCTVAASNSAGSSLVNLPSTPVIPVALPVALVPIPTSLPVITGTAVQGHTVGCSPGAWLNGPTSYAYSWQRDGANIASQVASQYALTAADVNQAITCTVVARNAVGSGPPAVSLPILPAALVGGSGGGTGGGSPGTAGSGSTSVGGSAGKLHPPSLLSFSVSPRRMVVTARGRRLQTRGVSFSFRLSQAAGVTVAIERVFNGRMVGRRCVARPSRRANGRRCTGYTTVARITARSAPAGLDRMAYAGRAGRAILAPGGYRAVIAAANAAGKSNSRSAPFAVTRKSATVRSRRR